RNCAPVKRPRSNSSPSRCWSSRLCHKARDHHLKEVKCPENHHAVFHPSCACALADNKERGGPAMNHRSPRSTCAFAFVFGFALLAASAGRGQYHYFNVPSGSD